MRKLCCYLNVLHLPSLPSSKLLSVSDEEMNHDNGHHDASISMMNSAVDIFKHGFFSLHKLCRNELLKKMLSDLNKPQLDILLKHLDKISVTSEVYKVTEPSVPDLFHLMSYYESLDVAQKLEVLVEILDNLRSCDSEDLVEIIDNRLDELINNNENCVGSDEDCDDDIDDHDNDSDDDEEEDIVFVDPNISYSEDNANDADLESSNNSGGYSNSLILAAEQRKLQFPSHFLQSNSLQSHLEDDEENKFCDLCEKFVKRKGWYKHMNTVHSTQRFSCTLCPNSKFKAKKYWKAHMRNIHKDLNIQFPDGRSAGASTFGLLGPGLRCGECFMAFTSVDQLKHHSDTVHKHKSLDTEDTAISDGEEDTGDSEDVAEMASAPLRLETQVQCKSCSKSFRSLAELSVHEQAVHNTEYAQCPYCLIMTKSLRNHIKFVHMKKFQCELCQKSFSANAKLTRHLESHLRGTNRIHHPGSEQQLIPSDQMASIILPRDRPKNIKCDLCGYKCVSTWKLNRHMNAHRKGTNRYSLH